MDRGLYRLVSFSYLFTSSCIIVHLALFSQATTSRTRRPACALAGVRSPFSNSVGGFEKWVSRDRCQEYDPSVFWNAARARWNLSAVCIGEAGNSRPRGTSHRNAHRGPMDAGPWRAGQWRAGRRPSPSDVWGLRGGRTGLRFGCERESACGRAYVDLRERGGTLSKVLFRTGHDL